MVLLSFMCIGRFAAGLVGKKIITLIAYFLLVILEALEFYVDRARGGEIVLS